MHHAHQAILGQLLDISQYELILEKLLYGLLRQPGP